MMLGFLIATTFIIWTVRVLLFVEDNLRKFGAFYVFLAAVAVMFSPAIHVPPGSWGMISLCCYALWEAGRWLNEWALRQKVKS